MNIYKLFKISGLSAISTTIKTLVGIGITKLIAIYIGAEGLAFIGNLKNVLTSVTGLSTGGIDNGITKYIATSKSELERNKIFHTSIFIGITSSIVLSVIFFLSAEKITFFIFQNTQYIYLIKTFSFFIPFSALNIVINKFLNGKERYKKLVLINILASLISLTLTSPLIIYYHLAGAVLSFIITPLILFTVTIFIAYKDLPSLNLRNIKEYIISNYIKKLLSFSIITVTTTIITPLTLIIVRNIIIQNLNIHSAGIWDAVNLISNNYFTFVSLTLGLFILPEFSKANAKNKIIEIISTTIKTLLPIFIFGLVIIFIFRSLIIKILLSDDFYEVSEYIGYQLIGDGFKFISWIFGMFLIAKAKTKYFITIQLISAFKYSALTFIFIYFWGNNGIYQAYLLNYLTHLPIVLYYFYKSNN